MRLLQFIGEDPAREGLKETPARVLKAWKELSAGYSMDPATILSKTFTEEQYDEMVILDNLRFTSMCEHHMLPFSGTASVGYIPYGRVVGISKLARLVQCYAQRLQIQERMTQQIANDIVTYLNPKGVAVIIQAHHQCMGCRGVKQPDARMSTSCMLGAMRKDVSARAEFMRLIGK